MSRVVNRRRATAVKTERLELLGGNTCPSMWRSSIAEPHEWDNRLLETRLLNRECCLGKASAAWPEPFGTRVEIGDQVDRRP